MRLANTGSTSEDTITHYESNRTLSLCDFDTSANTINVASTIGKRHKVFRHASPLLRASQFDPGEAAASSRCPLERLVANLVTGDDEQSELDHTLDQLE